MKLYLILALLIANYSLKAQKIERGASKPSKEERREYREKAKKLKKEFKEYFGKDAGKFQQLKNDSLFFKKRADSLAKEIDKLKGEEAKASEKAESIKEEQSLIEAEIAKMKKTLAEAQKRGIPLKGTFHAVEIGNLNQSELDKIKNDPNSKSNVNMEQLTEDTYLIGLYQTITPANQLKRHIRSMGIRKVWIVTYTDGKLMKTEPSPK